MRDVVVQILAACFILALLLTGTVCSVLIQSSAYTGEFLVADLTDTTVSYVKPADRSEWSHIADQMQSFLWNQMLGENGTLCNYYSLEKGAYENGSGNYWIQAQFVDSLADAYLRTGDPVYAQRAKDLMLAEKRANGNHLTNEFYDDMGWMACAMAKLYKATGDPDYELDLKLLYEVIMDGWYYQGGISWQKGQIYYRNSPAQGPACILACRMYDLYGDQEYLDMALQIFTWWDGKLVNHNNGLVWDGYNREGNDRIDYSWVFTYNQGVYIGACVELYRILGDPAYLDKATLTANYTLKHLVNSDGVLQADGTADSDAGAFKGIFCRYLVELIETTEQNRETYADFLVKNAEAMWSNIPSEEAPLCGAEWNKPVKGTGALQAMSSGAALLESVAYLDTFGYLSDSDSVTE